jgi:hypothetical protein
LYRAFQIVACHLRSSMKSMSSRHSCSCIDSPNDWTRGDPHKDFRGKAGFGPADQGEWNLPGSLTLSSPESESPVKTSFRTPSDDWYPRPRFSRGHLAVVDPFFARPVTRWGAIPGSLLAPFADALHELDDLATLRDAVATVGVHRA